ncbi:hypothetical protein [Streptomyces sp. NPDC003247]|uniref:hypothetical protein n=1 Tax=Streptomyces sp. NPDC003247 TaxID=3364677 RepID=UPI0036BBFEDE
MPDAHGPEEELTPQELAFLQTLDQDRGWRPVTPAAETPPPPPPGRAGASTAAVEPPEAGDPPSQTPDGRPDTPGG